MASGGGDSCTEDLSHCEHCAIDCACADQSECRAMGFVVLILFVVAFAACCVCGCCFLKNRQRQIQERQRQLQQATTAGGASTAQPISGIAMPTATVASAVPVMPAAALIPAAPQSMTVTCPIGCKEGDAIQLSSPMGMMQVIVPPGITSGMVFQVQLAPTAPVASAVAVPVMQGSVVMAA